jgi:hypothetical protein
MGTDAASERPGGIWQSFKLIKYVSDSFWTDLNKASRAEPRASRELERNHALPTVCRTVLARLVAAQQRLDRTGQAWQQ